MEVSRIPCLVNLPCERQARAAADREGESAWLMRTRLVWKAGYSRIKGRDRYLRAIRSRLGRLTSLPQVKVLEKMERVRKCW